MNKRREKLNNLLNIKRRVSFFFIIILLSITLTNCFFSSPPTKRYYTLSYILPEVENKSSKFNISIRVQTPNIGETYNRPQIVYRTSPHEIQYYNYKLWTVKPQKMIADIIVKELEKCGLFADVTSGIQDRVPDYTLTSFIESIEEIDSGDIWFAHFAMNFKLIRENDGQIVINHSFNRREKVFTNETSVIVRTLSEIMQEEMENLEGVLDKYFSELYGYPIGNLGKTEKKVVEKIKEDKEELNPEDTWEAVSSKEQLRSDPVILPTGKSAIFVPTMTSGLREPLYQILKNGELYKTGEAGKKVIVEPGKYKIKIGSGIGSQQISIDVNVKEGEVYKVKPEWAGLVVRVVDDKDVPFRGNYDIIYVPTREFYGTGYGVDEESGEELKTWILKPGLYKIVKVGETYRTRRNFSTVKLEKGELTHFTIVMDRYSEDFLGAGVSDYELELSRLGNWKLNMILGGNFLLNNRKYVTGTPSGNNISFSLYFDTLASYNLKNHHLNFRLEIEEGQSKQPDDDAFYKTLDRADFDSIYIYKYTNWLGNYIRFSYSSNFFPSYRYINTPVKVETRDENDQLISTTTYNIEKGYKQKEVKLSDSFSPLNFQEGIGVNLSLLRKKYIDWTSRLGIGAWQTISRNLYVEVKYVESSDPNNPNLFIRKRVVSQFREGIEVALLGNIRISKWILISTEFEFLEPFNNIKQPIYEWENSSVLRLGKYTSLNYITSIKRDPSINIEHPTSFDQSIILRFSYEFF